jgi:hypothetical protein
MEANLVLNGHIEYEQFGYDFDLSNQPQGLVIAISSLTQDSKLERNNALEAKRGGVVNLFSLNENNSSLIATLKSDRPYSAFGSKIKVI